MAEQKKFLDATGVKKVKEDYEKKIAVKVDPSALEEYLKLENIDTQLEGYLKKADIATALTDYATNEEVTGQLADYMKSADADGKYATKAELLQIDVPVVEQSALEGMKESATSGDMAIVSDDNYHIYVYDGTDWHDIGAHVNLADYAKKTDLEAKANASDLPIALTEEEIEEILNPPVM